MSKLQLNPCSKCRKIMPSIYENDTDTWVGCECGNKTDHIYGGDVSRSYINHTATSMWNKGNPISLSMILLAEYAIIYKGDHAGNVEITECRGCGAVVRGEKTVYEFTHDYVCPVAAAIPSVKDKLDE